MFDNLNELVRDNVQDAVINNKEIPNEQNEAAIGAASTSIFDALKNQISSGNASGLADVFNGGSIEGSAVVQHASSSFTEKLDALGVNSDIAKKIAASVIPIIISKLTKKTADPADSSFNIQDILGKLSGDDGKFDVNDVIGMFKGHHNQQSEAGNFNGGIVDKLKGMFN